MLSSAINTEQLLFILMGGICFRPKILVLLNLYDASVDQGWCGASVAESDKAITLVHPSLQ